MSDMKNVFILEDSYVQVMRLKKMLEKCGYNLIGTASTGMEAVEKVLDLKPDIVFIDIIIEGDMDGIGAAEEIRRSMDVPIIFTTNYSNSDLVGRALNVSPHAYMLKPLDEDQLRVTLETTCKRIELENEKKELTRQLFLTQKMEAIGQLAGGIAHNFNNILSVMVGNAEMAMKHIDPESENHSRVQRILKSGMSARELTNKMLALTRPEIEDFSVFPARKAIEEIWDVIRESISKSIRVEVSLQDIPGMIKGDINQITQAILNICINACDAMKEGGILSISARELELDAESAMKRPDIKQGKYYCISIKDTGPGIPEEISERIFEPFFTTKKDRGTGLGLYVTMGIMNAHGGWIDIDNGPAGGTTINLCLPLTEGVESNREQSGLRQQDLAGTGTILLVDDEQDFLEVTSELLELEGYRTFTALDGRSALETFEKHRNEIDLVLLDVMMPGMTGDEVYRCLKEIDSGVKVVVCTGFSEEGKAGALVSQGVQAFLQKPFVFPELNQTISSAMKT